MHIRSTVRFLSIAFALAATAPTLQAQLAAPATSQEAAAGPRREAAVAGVRTSAVAAADLPAVAQPRQGNTGRAAALTIIGTAAFIGGLLIGDDAGTAIAVGGLVVGLIGLWQWMR